jgi:putative oxidoreductase
MAAPGASKVYGSDGDAGRLVLRVALGVLILFHGVAKITGGIGFVTGALTKAGMPADLGYLVYIGEVLAPLLLIVGAWTRPAALVIAINMVVAVLLVGGSRLFAISKMGGGYALELEAIYLFAAVAVALLGAGRYSVSGAHGRWN